MEAGSVLDCDEILYRAAQVRHFAWDCDLKAPVAGASLFLLRLTPPETDLSVSRARLIGVQESFALWEAQHLRNVAAAYSLHAGRVRDLGLNPLATGHSGNEAHASILGLPVPGETDDVAYGQALDLAARLLEMARFVCWRSEDRRVEVYARCRASEADLC